MVMMMKMAIVVADSFKCYHHPWMFLHQLLFQLTFDDVNDEDGDDDDDDDDGSAPNLLAISEMAIGVQTVQAKLDLHQYWMQTIMRSSSSLLSCKGLGTMCYILCTLFSCT